MKHPFGLVAYRALSDAIGKGTLLLVTVLAARRLSPVHFGVLALGSTAGWVGAVAADFGMQQHVARTVARRRDDSAGLWYPWLRIRIATAAGVTLLSAALVAAFRLQSFSATAIVLLVGAYAVGGLTEFSYYFFRGLGRSAIESTLHLGQRITTLAVAMAVLTWRPHVVTLAVALLVPAALTCLVSLGWASRLAAGSRRGVSSPRHEFPRHVLPIGLGIVLSALYFRVDIVLLARWQETEIVGSYNAVFRLVEALRLGPAAVLAVWLPTLCRAVDFGPLVRVSGIVTSLATMATLILLALAEWVVPFLYGTAHTVAVPAFRILLLAFPLMALNYGLTTQLIGWNGHHWYATLCAAALAFNVGLNARWIPRWSLVGASWATVATEALLTLGCLGALSLLKARTGTTGRTERGHRFEQTAPLPLE